MIAPLPSAPLTPNEERLRKAQAEKNALRKSYNAAKRADLGRMVERYPLSCKTLGKLVTAIRRMEQNEGPQIVDLVAHSRIIDDPEDMRAFALGHLGTALMRRREALGLVPFDDPLPPRKNAYLAIKELLNVK